MTANISRIPGPVMQHIFSYVEEPTTTALVSKQWKKDTYDAVHNYLQSDPFFSDFYKRVKPLNLTGSARVQACFELVLSALDRLNKETYIHEPRHLPYNAPLSLDANDLVNKMRFVNDRIRYDQWTLAKTLIDRLAFDNQPFMDFLNTLPLVNDFSPNEEKMQWEESVKQWIYAPENKKIVQNLLFVKENYRRFPLWAIYFPNRQIAFAAFCYWLDGDFANLRSFIENSLLDQFNDNEMKLLNRLSRNMGHSHQDLCLALIDNAKGRFEVYPEDIIPLLIPMLVMVIIFIRGSFELYGHFKNLSDDFA